MSKTIQTKPNQTLLFYLNPMRTEHQQDESNWHSFLAHYLKNNNACMSDTALMVSLLKVGWKYLEESKNIDNFLNCPELFANSQTRVASDLSFEHLAIYEQKRNKNQGRMAFSVNFKGNDHDPLCVFVRENFSNKNILPISASAFLGCLCWVGLVCSKRREQKYAANS